MIPAPESPSFIAFFDPSELADARIVLDGDTWNADLFAATVIAFADNGAPMIAKMGSETLERATDVAGYRGLYTYGGVRQHSQSSVAA